MSVSSPLPQQTDALHLVQVNGRADTTAHRIEATPSPWLDSLQVILHVDVRVRCFYHVTCSKMIVSTFGAC